MNFLKFGANFFKTTSKFQVLQMRICVAEKPSIAKGVVKILSNNNFNTSEGWKYCKNFKFELNGTPTIMTSVAGHCMSIDFQDPNLKKDWRSTNPVDLMTARIDKSISKDMVGIARNLERLARNCSELIILTDNDREGEYIGFEIVHIMTKTNRRFPVKRMRFSVVQSRDIWSAFNNLGVIDDLQVQAVDCRIELDLRIGAAFTRYLTNNLKRFTSESVISYGSCQFPTLGFVVKRYKERNDFVPEPFFGISVHVVKDRINHAFNWQRGHLFNEQVVDAIHASLSDNSGIITRVEKKNTSKWAPLPLTTVEMQKCGSRLLRIPSAQLMKIAESLYQKGIISYPRTETDQFTADFNLKDLIVLQQANNEYRDYADKLVNGDLYRFPRKGTHNDKAHPPIHPCGNGSSLTGNDRRVFDFIARRFLACCSKDATGFQTSITLCLNNEIFHTSGLQVLQRNYLEIYPFDTWKSVEIADFTENEEIKNIDCKMINGRTTAPQLLTEADLIGLMDTHGIGTDATMHDHISKILYRKYVENSSKFIIPTSLGLALCEGLDSIPATNMSPLSEPQLRAEMENNLNAICSGAKVKQNVLNSTIQKYIRVYNCMNNFDRDIQRIFQNKVQEQIQAGNENQEELAPQVQNNRQARQIEQPRYNQNRVEPIIPINRQAPLNRPATNPLDYFANDTNEPEIRCDCGLIATKKSSNSEDNKNRKYHSCPKAGTKCKFFKWEDEERVENENNQVHAGALDGYKCFICQDSGHMANVCPNKKGKKVKTTKRKFKKPFKKK